MADTDDQKLIAADAAWKAADAAALRALRGAIQIGRLVEWRHGDAYRAGVVLAVRGYSYEHARLYVESTTSGKRYDVDAHAIVRVIREEEPADA